MINYDKTEIKNNLTLDNIFELLNIWGGNPEYSEFGILSETICHNEPGVGSKKLYYYSNSQLFKCYTGCDDIFDIFELVIKVAYIQSNKEYDLNDAVRWIANYFGIAGSVEEDTEKLGLEDWKFLANYDKNNIEEQKDLLKEIDEDTEEIEESFIDNKPKKKRKNKKVK